MQPSLLIIGALSLAVAALGLALWRARRLLARLQAQAQSADAQTRHLEERSRAVARERELIYKDLHDDLSSKLLALVYGATDPKQADLARSVLQDLRDIVSRSRRPPGHLLQVLGEIRQEAEQRLRAVSAQLDWQLEALPDPLLDQAQTLHLMRICREAITNAIRHGNAGWLRVRASHSGGQLLLDITDDGRYDAQAPAGSGTGNMRERAGELQGDIRWDAGTLGGTKVTLRMQLAATPGTSV